MALFQLLSDSIAHLMRDYYKLLCYIDDYVAVLPKHKVNAAFDKLCSLLQDLDLPLNRGKLTPPLNVSHIWALTLILIVTHWP